MEGQRSNMTEEREREEKGEEQIVERDNNSRVQARRRPDDETKTTANQSKP